MAGKGLEQVVREVDVGLIYGTIKSGSRGSSSASFFATKLNLPVLLLPKLLDQKEMNTWICSARSSILCPRLKDLVLKLYIYKQKSLQV